MRALLMVLLATSIAGCRRDAVPAPDAGPIDPCDVLFGRPNDFTGLGADRCQPLCSCSGVTWAPPDYSEEFVQALVDGWTPASPAASLTADPYAGPAPVEDPPETVCAVVPQASADAGPRPYSLSTFASSDEARAAGGLVTHFGHCGVCSTLANLAVYIRDNDLTAPVRACGFKAVDFDGGTAFDSDVACLQALGFDLPCAQAWAWDTRHTRATCLDVCSASLADHYNLPDGTLNPCIQCDEDQSGPVFKAVAGRTRRNSGIPNAICRPCSEVRPLVHTY
jgi:hypothetical protein